MPKTIKERNRVIQTNSTQRLDHAVLKDRKENVTNELRHKPARKGSEKEKLPKSKQRNLG